MSNYGLDLHGFIIASFHKNDYGCAWSQDLRIDRKRFLIFFNALCKNMQL